jgi:hypothetical protein
MSVKLLFKSAPNFFSKAAIKQLLGYLFRSPFKRKSGNLNFMETFTNFNVTNLNN